MAKQNEEQPAFAPYDVEAEQALFGLLIINNDMVPLAASEVQPDDFFDPLHRQIATLIFKFDQDGKAITPLTLNTWLRHNLGYREVGGHVYLAGLAEAAPSIPKRDLPRMVRDLAKTIADLHLRMEAEGAVFDASEKLRRGDTTFESIQDVQIVADKIAAKENLQQGETHAGNVGYDLLRQIEGQATEEKKWGCTTGIDQLDEVIGALYPDNLIVIGGRPGMGKSILATGLCLVAAANGFAPDYWSLEMPKRECAARMMTDIDFSRCGEEQLKPLHYTDLVQMKASGGQLQRAGEANARLLQLPIQIFDQGNVTMSRIAAISRARAAASDLPKLIVIDHLQIIDTEGQRGETMATQLARVTKAAKQLAKQISAPVVLLSQLNRDLERRDDKHPYLADFRDSGSIEQDADIVLGLYRPLYYAVQKIRAAKNGEQRANAMAEAVAAEGKLEIGILKNRSGRTDDVECFIHPAASAIRSEKPTGPQIDMGV